MFSIKDEKRKQSSQEIPCNIFHCLYDEYYSPGILLDEVSIVSIESCLDDLVVVGTAQFQTFYFLAFQLTIFFVLEPPEQPKVSWFPRVFNNTKFA